MEGSTAMGWATHACEVLRRGETVTVRPRGHSMKGRGNDGDHVTVAPCDPSTLQVGDIVLVRVHGHEYLHLIQAIQEQRFLIGNNRGGINGWVGAHAIFGRATAVTSSQ
jgi:SOS-response transcriptional repressor LexA